MRLSTRGRYAVMAMVELAAREARGGVELATREARGGVELATREARGGGELAARGGTEAPSAQMSLAEIASAQHLSLAYLEQLFGPLRRAGLVTSARGPGGGYRLARPAGHISVAEIVQAVDEPIQATRCEEGGPGCLAGQRCLTHDLWAELGDQIRLFLEGVTLADVVGGQVVGRAVAPKDAGEAAADLARAAQ